METKSNDQYAYFVRNDDLDFSPERGVTIQAFSSLKEAVADKMESIDAYHGTYAGIEESLVIYAVPRSMVNPSFRVPFTIEASPVPLAQVAPLETEYRKGLAAKVVLLHPDKSKQPRGMTMSNYINELTQGHPNDDPQKYRLLARLEQDCKYFLGNGNRNNRHLWADNVDEQIDAMKKIYHSIETKPEWLTLADIEKFEADMKGRTQQNNADANVLSVDWMANKLDMGDLLESGSIQNYAQSCQILAASHGVSLPDDVQDCIARWAAAKIESFMSTMSFDGFDDHDGELLNTIQILVDFDDEKYLNLKETYDDELGIPSCKP